MGLRFGIRKKPITDLGSGSRGQKGTGSRIRIRNIGILCRCLLIIVVFLSAAWSSKSELMALAPNSAPARTYVIPYLPEKYLFLLFNMYKRKIKSIIYFRILQKP
jgi:hypothetical protein